MNEKDYEKWISFFNLIQMIFAAICVIGIFTSVTAFWVGAVVCLFVMAFRVLFNLKNGEKFDWGDFLYFIFFIFGLFIVIVYLLT